MSLDFKFGAYPKRSARPTDRFATALEQLMRGIVRQQSYLNSDHANDLNPKDRGHWYRVVDGVYYCWLYVSNVALDLNGNDQPIIAATREEAKQVYEQLYEQVEAGEYNELIRNHLADIPPRNRNAAAAS